MEPVGPKIAEGRDTEIFEHGPGRVLRRARDRRSLATEAAVMEHARRHGYPVPAVHEADADSIVMDRLEGLNMLEDIVRRPWRMPAHARTLAELHEQLHEIPADDGIPVGPWPAPTLAHYDLHPLNVMITAEGPVVIDWSNGCSGEPGSDLAMTWLLMASGDPDAGRLASVAVAAVRGLFLRTFLRHAGRDEARRWLRPVADLKVLDENMRPAETRAMEELVAREGTT